MASRARLTAPRVVFPLLAALLLLTILFTPTAGDERGRLSSFSVGPGGARALYEVAERLGWEVERRTTPFTTPVAPGVVYAVLDPVVPVTAGEVHRLLEAVRAGAGLLMVVQQGSALTDSLGLTRSRLGAAADQASDGFCADSLNRYGLITWPDGRVHSWWLTRYPRANAVTFTQVRILTPRLDSPTRARGTAVRRDTVVYPAAVGFPYGRGRVVAVADPDLLRNDVLRVCRWNAGPTAMRMLEGLAPAGGRHVIFSEYHQGHGVQADPIGAVWRALAFTPAGRTVLQGVVAALVLLAAIGARPIAPTSLRTVERRSPLEHVGALARAYEQVGATRLAARRLVRGLRRRHGAGARTAGATGDDAEFLRALGVRHPVLANDVALLERAVAHRLPAADFSTVGAAVARIDHRLRPEHEPTS